MTARVRRLRRRPPVHRPEVDPEACETCQGTGAVAQIGDALVSVDGLSVGLEYRPPRPSAVARDAKAPPAEMTTCPDCGGTGRKK